MNRTQKDALSKTSDFWKNFYLKHSLKHEPTPFAKWCSQENYVNEQSNILELGCGNGRDSFTFLHHGFSVIAIDGCEIAIEDNLMHYKEKGLKTAGSFYALNFADLEKLEELTCGMLKKVNTLYSRFVLHAIPEELEDKVLEFAARLLPVGGRMLHEFRTVRDPLMQKGEVLSSNERLTDHYRRFIDPDVFRAKLVTLGWKEVFFIESNGLATFGDDDPVVARIIVEKI